MNLLIIIAIIWLIAASYTDLKKREIANWISFSLIGIALATKSIESIVSWTVQPITFSIIGLTIFLVLANIFYYGKIFAGGDAKLLIAMGPIIANFNFLSNLLIIGGIYGIAYSLWLAISKKEKFYEGLKKINKNNPNKITIALISILVLGLILNLPWLYFFSTAILLVYFLQIFLNIVEKNCLIQKISPKSLTEGDWLFKKIKIGKEKIKPNFQGLTTKQIKLLKKRGKKVYIKYGIPFVPVFLIAFLITIRIGNILMIFIK